MKRAFLVLILAAGLAAAADNVAEVQKLETTMQQSLVHKDMKTLNQLVTDDFIRTPPAGAPTTKAEWLGMVESGRLNYMAFEVIDAKFRDFGETVIVHASVHIRTKSGNNETDQNLRLLDIWVKQKDGWHIAAIQGNNSPAK